MKSDFDLIVHKLDKNLERINIYPICEPHIGSEFFSQKLWDKWFKMVVNDPFGYVIGTGDMADNALKGSKSNSYKAKLSPEGQLDWLVDNLYPIKDRILGFTDGNHEKRSVDSDGISMVHTLSKILGIEDYYRQNMAFLKINLGEKRTDRQVSYTIVLGHGGSKGKVDKFGYAIDGMDVLVTGHTHCPNSDFPAKIVIDSHNEVVRVAGFSKVVVPSFQDVGGYTLQGMYMPQDNTKMPRIELNGKEKEVSIHWK